MIPRMASKSPMNVRTTQTLLHLNNMVWASCNSGVVTVPGPEEGAEACGEGLVLKKFRK